MREVRHWRMGGGRSRVDGPGSFRMKPAKVRQALKMRKEPTGPERMLDEILKRTGIRYHRQVLTYGYIADFYVPEAGLVIEADGPQHIEHRSYDLVRDRNLAEHDIETLRITADRLRTSPAQCERDIRKAVATRRARWQSVPTGPRTHHRRPPAYSGPPVARQPFTREGDHLCPTCKSGYRDAGTLLRHRSARHNYLP